MPAVKQLFPALTARLETQQGVGVCDPVAGNRVFPAEPVLSAAGAVAKMAPTAGELAQRNEELAGTISALMVDNEALRRQLAEEKSGKQEIADALASVSTSLALTRTASPDALAKVSDLLRKRVAENETARAAAVELEEIVRPQNSSQLRVHIAELSCGCAESRLLSGGQGRLNRGCRRRERCQSDTEGASAALASHPVTVLPAVLEERRGRNHILSHAQKSCAMKLREA